MPLKAGDHLSTGILIGPYDLAQVFRVELARKASGVHQVTEQHGELAAFRVRNVWGVDRRGSRDVFHRRSLVRGGFLRRKRWGAGSWGRCRGTSPHQDTARLIDGQLLPINEFVL